MSNSEVRLRRKWKPDIAKAHTQLVILQTLISERGVLRWSELVKRTDLPPSALKLRLNEMIKQQVILRAVARSKEYPPPVMYSMNSRGPSSALVKMAFFLTISGMPQYYRILIPTVKIATNGESIIFDSDSLPYWWKIHIAIHSFLFEKAIGWGENITEEEKQLFRLVVNELSLGSPLLHTGFLVTKMGYGWDVGSLVTTEHLSHSQAFADWEGSLTDEKLVLEFLYRHGRDIFFEGREAPTRLDHEAIPKFQHWLKSRFEEFKRKEALK